jgi:CelD/BcsL family acetyltransferase involved in cellulose biosynthesis
VLLSYFYGGSYSFFIGGFEPELMRWSVGTCLFSRVLRHAIEEGATEFDFLKGEEITNTLWGTKSRLRDALVFQLFATRQVIGAACRLQRRRHAPTARQFSAAHRKPD